MVTFVQGGFSAIVYYFDLRNRLVLTATIVREQVNEEKNVSFVDHLVWLPIVNLTKLRFKTIGYRQD